MARRLEWGGLAAGVALAGAAAAATPDVSYPSSQEPSAVADWLTRETVAPLDQAVAVGPGFVFILDPVRTGDPETTVHRIVREELTDPRLAETLGGRSAVMEVEFDCRQRRFRFIGTRLFAGAKLSGEAQAPAVSREWTRQPGSYMDIVLQAACDPGFVPPLARYAAAASAAPAPKPASEAPVAAPSALNPPAREGSVQATAARVQVGSYFTETRAQDAVTDFAAAVPEAQGRKLVVEPRRIAGRPVLRLFVGGFADTGEAAAFCRRLREIGRECLIVRGEAPAGRVARRPAAR